MNSKKLMIASSIFTGLLGISASFFPTEILNNLGLTTTEIPTLLVQIAGALYLGFAVMNWMAKTVIIGGIYARLLCMGNFLHFMVAAIALIKTTMSNSGSPLFMVGAISYSIFALLFGLVLFTNPSRATKVI